jgi:hypothetical protein
VPGRPPKPIALVKGHRTKREKEIREKAERQLLTGIPLKELPEVKSNPIAHKEFVRLKKLLKSIGHDDDLYGAVVNDQCKLRAEEFQLLEDKKVFTESLERLEESWQPEGMKFNEYMKLKVAIQGQICYCDKAIMNKRKMKLSISRENIMTIQSALRSIPKKPVEETEEDPMARLLGGERHVR